MSDLALVDKQSKNFQKDILARYLIEPWARILREKQQNNEDLLFLRIIRVNCYEIVGQYTSCPLTTKTTTSKLVATFNLPRYQFIHEQGNCTYFCVVLLAFLNGLKMGLSVNRFYHFLWQIFVMYP